MMVLVVRKKMVVMVVMMVMIDYGNVCSSEDDDINSGVDYGYGGNDGANGKDKTGCDSDW